MAPMKGAPRGEAIQGLMDRKSDPVEMRLKYPILALYISLEEDIESYEKELIKEAN